MVIGGDVYNGTIMSNTVQVNAGGTLRYARTDGIGNNVAVAVNGGTVNLASYSDYIGSLALSNGAQVQGDGTVPAAGEFNLGNVLVVNGTSGLISASGTGNAISSRLAITSAFGVTGGARTQEISVADGGDLTISGSIIDTAYRSDASYLGSLLKTGGGTLTLTGANTYTGNTTVDGGSLVLNGGALTMDINSSGSSTQVVGDSVFDVNGKLVFDLDGVTGSGSWSVIAVNTLSETYGAGFGITFSRGSITLDGVEESAGVWSRTLASLGTASFNEATGVLTITAVPEPSVFGHVDRRRYRSCRLRLAQAKVKELKNGMANGGGTGQAAPPFAARLRRHTFLSGTRRCVCHAKPSKVDRWDVRRSGCARHATEPTNVSGTA